MKKRLFIYTTLIIFVGFLGFLFVSVYITSKNNLNIVKSTVMETARIYAGLFQENMDLGQFVSVGGDTRITVVSTEGIVLADSYAIEPATSESYLYLPEIIAAATSFPAVHVRQSNTHNAAFVYYALQVPAYGSPVFVRAAMPVERVDSYLIQSLSLLIVLLLILAVVAFFIVRVVVTRILKPLNELEQNLRHLSNNTYSQASISKSYEELDTIIKEIDSCAIFLQKNYNALHDEKNKLTCILDSIGDGLFVADENFNITLVNISARNIFGSHDVEGKKLNYLVSNKALAASVEDCIASAKNALFEFAHNGKTFLVTIKRLPDTNLTMVALAEITENRENAKRREEFFANASHELKTPLTAIKGFNELTAINNKDEGLGKYIDSIARETNRMMSLIGDMLKLSELENTEEVIQPVNVSLAAVVNEAKDTVLPAMQEKAIKFEATGDAQVLSDPAHLYDVVKNLIENAVRYNNIGGKVTVKIESLKKSTHLTVSDNGRGISPNEQTKIFERFYRVEKSRSGGGTGLGLSIVKHLCALYGWKLSLKSKLGIGTDVVVEFLPTKRFSNSKQ